MINYFSVDIDCSFHRSDVQWDCSRENVSEFSDYDQKLLASRAVADERTNKPLQICQTHRKMYLQNYEKNKRTCADPYGTHKTKVKTSLRLVTLYTSVKFKKIFPETELGAGQKLCTNCRKKVADAIEVIDRLRFFQYHLKRNSKFLSYNV